jgi:TonB family protein
LATIAPDTPRNLGPGWPPKKVRDAKPKYPAIPPGTTVRGTLMVYELLVGVDGKVAQVWTLRSVKFDRPFPAFDQAQVRALKQWEFEPYHVNGAATPFCMSVTTYLNLN